MSSLKVFCINTSDLSFSQRHSFSMWLMMSRAVNFIGLCPSINLSPACSSKKVCLLDFLILDLRLVATREVDSS
jgi:hypothetical protein